MLRNCLISKWAHQGMILGPPDYESGALTNWAIGPKNITALLRVAKIWKFIQNEKYAKKYSLIL